jgi:hypothetical protein
MKLYRQHKPAAWKPVISQMAQELQSRVLRIAIVSAELAVAS